MNSVNQLGKNKRRRRVKQPGQPWTCEKERRARNPGSEPQEGDWGLCQSGAGGRRTLRSTETTKAVYCGSLASNWSIDLGWGEPERKIGRREREDKKLKIIFLPIALLQTFNLQDVTIPQLWAHNTCRCIDNHNSCTSLTVSRQAMPIKWVSLMALAPTDIISTEMNIRVDNGWHRQ